MTIRYVGPGGSDVNSGLTWALRKLTLNGVEDTPVVAGDTIYIGPGTYRETLTVDVSGTAGNVTTYIGDYTGANTDGIGGIVRVTGSDNDQTATRANCVVASSKNYRTFSGIVFDTCTGSLLSLTSITQTTFQNCFFMYPAVSSNCIYCAGASQATLTISNCFIYGGPGAASINFTHTSVVDACSHSVQNCVFLCGSAAVYSVRVGGITVKNCTVYASRSSAFQVATALTAGQTMTVNNCIIQGCNVALSATVTTEFVENYNNLFANVTNRTNVDVGANSLAYPPLLDFRWFFEMVLGGGRLLSIFDLASFSQLLNVAGTSPTATDMRGTTIIGAQREWGALEYDSTLVAKPNAASRTIVGQSVTRNSVW
jgi:hypothetical protein